MLDDRDKFVSPERFPTASRRLVGDIGTTLRDLAPSLTPHTFAVIVTRGHNHDEEALYHLAPTACGYVGMIGSKRKIRLIFEDLVAQGIPAEALERVHAPLGFDIGSQTVPEIAVSIVAELIACRNLGGTDAARWSWTPVQRRRSGDRRRGSRRRAQHADGPAQAVASARRPDHPGTRRHGAAIRRCRSCRCGDRPARSRNWFRSRKPPVRRSASSTNKHPTCGRPSNAACVGGRRTSGRKPTDAWLLAPADHPTLDAVRRSRTVRIVPRDPSHSILIPVHGGRRGHPALVAWRHVAGIRALPADRGINAYFREHASDVREVPVSSRGVLCDLDTPEDYERLRASVGDRHA